MPDIRAFPQYFRAYRWDAKHRLYGYPPDEYQEFHWIASLEARFLWLRAKHSLESTASIYLLKEMIQWGGSQNGVLQKFEDGLGEVNLYEHGRGVVHAHQAPATAFEPREAGGETVSHAQTQTQDQRQASVNGLHPAAAPDGRPVLTPSVRAPLSQPLGGLSWRHRIRGGVTSSGEAPRLRRNERRQLLGKSAQS